jgi:hypothetical protein
VVERRHRGPPFCHQSPSETTAAASIARPGGRRVGEPGVRRACKVPKMDGVY